MIAFIMSHLMFEGDIFTRKTDWKDKIHLILVFGLISSVGSFFAIYEKKIYLDTSILVVIVAGLKGGVTVGLGAGLIGAIFRLVTFPPSGKFIIVTVIAGLLGGITGLLNFSGRQNRKEISMLQGFFVGAFIGVMQTFIVPWASPEIFVSKRFLFLITVPFLLVNGAAVCMYLFIMKTLQEKKEKQKIEELNAKAQLKLLQSQIKPHFLFNALNTIASFSRKDPEKTRNLIQSLSEFLRVTLKTTQTSISIEEELENLEFYLEIEKARFGDKLEFVQEIDKNSLHFKIPFMSIQPLVENSVKHGFHEDGRTLVIKLKTNSKEKGVFIEIEDNGKGIETSRLKEILNFDKESEAIGLQNVIKRIKAMFKEKANIEVKSEPNKGTKVEISVTIDQ
jgi:LytS/YehU family sensor histidine kinase